MHLVIVESPNKTAKIRGFLGAGYQVAACFGHVRDLPAVGDLGVTFSDGRVIPNYTVLERSTSTVENLRRLAERADTVLLATDPDREGEAIAWHLAALIGRPCTRVTFQAITKEAVSAAMRAPRAIDQHLVDAQQARRILDRVVGWVVSPTLRRIGRDAKSAGRVQSVALRLVAEREREIGAFDKVEYHTLIATLDGANPPRFPAELVRWKGEPLGHRLRDPAVAERTVEWCRRQEWRVLGSQRKESLKSPPPPFTTATVQQAASVKLKLDPATTMKLLQQLFEDGHITYHRTDSVAIEPEGLAMARTVIARDYPPAYLPAQPVVHGQKSANAQEAHEAIRPTHADAPPNLSGDQGDLYRLIWERFIACQMSPGKDAVSTVDVACAPTAWEGGPMGIFQAKGVQVLFDGWRKLTADATEEKPRAKRGEKSSEPKAPTKLPTLEPGSPLDLVELAGHKRSTKPPPRYTQASLIKKLEQAGVGRPSTYANILATLLTRTYVEEKTRQLYATELGMAVTDFLIRRYAGNFIDVDYTARLESRLDAIARGELPWEREVTQETEAIRRLAAG